MLCIIAKRFVLYEPRRGAARKPMMRYGLMLAAALAAMFTTSAHADDEWCGYATGDKALIECGYSSVAQCENAVGKGGVCFVDPEYALQTKRPTRADRPRLTAER
jgi:Protein of unknown function (DUF3551)